MFKETLMLNGLAQDRVSQKIGEVKREYSKSIIDLLRETNQAHLQGKGKISSQPIVDRNTLRWTLAWGQGRVSFDLNIVVSVEDNGRQAEVERVLVHRHASAPFDFNEHMPTTRMRRVVGLSIAELRGAVNAEFPRNEA